MKFKVGDRVLAIDSIGKFKDWTEGIVSEVPTTSPNYRVRFPCGVNLYVKDSESIKPLPSGGNPKIVITADGKTTLARLYDGDKVVKSKEAKCSPSDTFSFQTGAELAFKRIFENPVEKPEPPKVEKPKFSWEAFMAGKIAVHCDTEEKAKEFCAAARDRFPDKFRTWWSGETNWEKYGTETRYGISDIFKYGTWGFDGYTIIEYPFSPAPEPKTEPVKLYCVKSHGTFFVRGNVYETDAKGYMCMEGMTSLCTFDSTDDFFLTHPQLKGYLVPLVKRPAKVGEWVYITASGDNRAVVGEIYEVVDTAGGLFVKHPAGCRSSDRAANIYPSSYLVLDGYQPEEKKPEYWSGKAVCINTGVSEHFTCGKVYKVTDGILTCDEGDAYNGPSDLVKTPDDLLTMFVPKFIEYKGEA